MLLYYYFVFVAIIATLIYFEKDLWKIYDRDPAFYADAYGFRQNRGVMAVNSVKEFLNPALLVFESVAPREDSIMFSNMFNFYVKGSILSEKYYHSLLKCFDLPENWNRTLKMEAYIDDEFIKFDENGYFTNDTLASIYDSSINLGFDLDFHGISIGIHKAVVTILIDLWSKGGSRPVKNTKNPNCMSKHSSASVYHEFYFYYLPERVMANGLADEIALAKAPPKNWVRPRERGVAENEVKTTSQAAPVAAEGKVDTDQMTVSQDIEQNHVSSLQYDESQTIHSNKFFKNLLFQNGNSHESEPQTYVKEEHNPLENVLVSKSDLPTKDGIKIKLAKNHALSEPVISRSVESFEKSVLDKILLERRLQQPQVRNMVNGADPTKVTTQIPVSTNTGVSSSSAVESKTMRVNSVSSKLQARIEQATELTEILLSGESLPVADTIYYAPPLYIVPLSSEKVTVPFNVTTSVSTRYLKRTVVEFVQRNPYCFKTKQLTMESLSYPFSLDFVVEMTGSSERYDVSGLLRNAVPSEVIATWINDALDPLVGSADSDECVGVHCLPEYFTTYDYVVANLTATASALKKGGIAPPITSEMFVSLHVNLDGEIAPGYLTVSFYLFAMADEYDSSSSDDRSNGVCDAVANSWKNRAVRSWDTVWAMKD